MPALQGLCPIHASATPHEQIHCATLHMGTAHVAQDLLKYSAHSIRYEAIICISLAVAGPYGPQILSLFELTTALACSYGSHQSNIKADTMSMTTGRNNFRSSKPSEDVPGAMFSTRVSRHMKATSKSPLTSVVDLSRAASRLRTGDLSPKQRRLDRANALSHLRVASWLESSSGGLTILSNWTPSKDECNASRPALNTNSTSSSSAVTKFASSEAEIASSRSGATTLFEVMPESAVAPEPIHQLEDENWFRSTGTWMPAEDMEYPPKVLNDDVFEEERMRKARRKRLTTLLRQIDSVLLRLQQTDQDGSLDEAVDQIAVDFKNLLTDQEPSVLAEATTDGQMHYSMDESNDLNHSREGSNSRKHKSKASSNRLLRSKQPRQRSQPQIAAETRPKRKQYKLLRCLYCFGMDPSGHFCRSKHRYPRDLM